LADGEWKRVAALSDLDEDYPKGIHSRGTDIALYLMDGQVYATDGVCTHAYAMLSDGHIEDGKVFCPLHQGSFDIKTGAAVDVPCTEGIKVIPVKVEGDDVLVKLQSAQP
jgi:nitrite reductase/ring-hydroxylating ferredoxin subunit